MRCGICWTLTLRDLSLPQLAHEPRFILNNNSQTPCEDTHHLTLAHNATSMLINTKICTFPLVATASETNRRKSATKAISRDSKRVGWRDDPGARSVLKNDWSSRGAAGAWEVDAAGTSDIMGDAASITSALDACKPRISQCRASARGAGWLWDLRSETRS